MAVLPISLFAIALLCLNFRLIASQDAGTCQNTCGGLPVMYPFGTGKGCGSPAFEQYINCTKGRLQLFTPRGQYYVQSIDYTNNLIVLQDPHMSTCSNMQYSSSFGLPVNAPFSLAGNTVVLLKCSSSSVYNSLTSLCDPTGTQICQGLYGCSSITQLGLPVDGPTSTCCVYSNTQISNPPYEIDLALLQCASYTSIYSFGSGNTNNFQNPNSWSYGIILRYYYDQSAYSVSCKSCQQSNGVCAFDVYGFVCVCSAGVNTTTRCFGYDPSHATRSLNLHQIFWSRGLIILGAVVNLLI